MSAQQHGKPWMDDEVELAFLLRASPENAVALAAVTGRTADAIKWAWRWRDGGNFPDRASNRIARQFADVGSSLRAMFGECTGVIESIDPAARGLVEARFRFTLDIVRHAVAQEQKR